MGAAGRTQQPRRPVALITGGSSGIGRALAIRLARDGFDLALLARGIDNLEETRRLVLEQARDAQVNCYPTDVGDAGSVSHSLDALVAEMGPPLWVVLNAGIARPGRFVEQPLGDHLDQMRTNYFGALHVAHAIAPVMAATGHGHLVFVSSGAAFFGIYGYGAYAPSKFAMRGLAEVLRVELAPLGIHVTLAYPPDTDTPQLVEESRSKPAATKEITAGGGLWSADRVAAQIVTGASRRRFLVAPGAQMRLLAHGHSLLSPLLRYYQTRIARKHDR
ncbi:SDR family oxidoreductase [Stappia sp. ES.058]|uniref:SDR family oxidoreductase n=1 Tax=Stappia sp. ES.058 TaxID=1881061 RepID=UPI0008797AFE|nr:SDR family oxidoreductase [Stappia sp. ES.058]SDU33793.1 3-dehydrosphinganine reductase [Stappia sp. ES.058]